MIKCQKYTPLKCAYFRAAIYLVMGVLLGFVVSGTASATGLEALNVNPNADGGETYSVSLQILIWMTLLSFIPAILMMMTSFTRIIVVLAILRQALGLQQTPSNQILIGLALFLTFFTMAPVLNQIYGGSVSPYLAGELTQTQAISSATGTIKQFMTQHTRENDLALFTELSGNTDIAFLNKYENDQPAEFQPAAFDPTTADPTEFSLVTLIPAFITSELKTAFQIGFLLFIPFLVIDLVIASVLMALGMMMLSPLVVSLPFKIMLFVLVDGWAMVAGTLASSFL